MEAPLHLIEQEERKALKEAIQTDKEEEERERLELLKEQGKYVFSFCFNLFVCCLLFIFLFCSNFRLFSLNFFFFQISVCLI
jgi:hypothetical protein